MSAKSVKSREVLEMGVRVVSLEGMFKLNA